MREPEIQPPIAPVLRRREVLRFLLGRMSVQTLVMQSKAAHLGGHRIPDLGSTSILPDVIGLHSGIEYDAVESADTDQPAISSSICHILKIQAEWRRGRGFGTHTWAHHPCGRCSRRLYSRLGQTYYTGMH